MAIIGKHAFSSAHAMRATFIITLTNSQVAPHAAQLLHLLPHERMPTQHGAVPPIIGFLVQTTFNKIQHVGAPRIWISERGCRFGRNHKYRPQRIQVSMRRRSLRHFNTGNAQTPHIGSPVVMILFYYFGCHPKRRSHHCLAFRNRVAQFGTHAEIRELDVSLVGEQDVSALDITMAYIRHAVQILQPQHYARTRGSYAIFRQTLLHPKFARF
mmetsp:Transcript_57782/g.69514  ORF Transcript_57782/g.69514 Transcript_57782/m.69514 type:complete len:213 (-) Transcript_57782:571-1209(-)